MKSTCTSYLLALFVVASYWMLYVGWYARFARKWLLPGSSLLLLALIPVTWWLFARRKKEERKFRSVLPQLGLIPVWLHSLYIARWVLGWMAIGGL